MNAPPVSLLTALLAVGLAFSRPAAQASTSTPSPSPTPLASLELPPPDLSASSIPLSDTPPESASVIGFVGHKQILSLSCESRSAVDWAGHYGVAIDELQFLRELPVSSDPDVGFVGDVRGGWGQVPPHPYGVHAGPVARLLQQYGLPAAYHLFTPWTSVQAEVAAGRPVIVWVTGHVEAGAGQRYTAPDGHRTVVAPFEHTVIVIGYDRYTVTIEDEGRHYRVFLDRFIESWKNLRNMSITANP